MFTILYVLFFGHMPRYEKKCEHHFGNPVFLPTRFGAFDTGIALNKCDKCGVCVKISD